MAHKDSDEILRVNGLFYEALGTRDLDLMDRVWTKDSRSGCVHPGWTALRNWEAIRQSWESVFDPQDQVDISISNVTVDVRNDVAWVTCLQEMIYIKREPVMFNLSQSTNIFEKKSGRWLMIFHHASPVPVQGYEPENKTIQ